ncbi:unnamed protein product, partial [Brassica oleracea var. botrytis]
MMLGRRILTRSSNGKPEHRRPHGEPRNPPRASTENRPKRRNGTESAYTKQDTVNPKAAKTGEQRWSACRNDTNTDTATTTTQPLSLRRTRLRRTNPAGQLDRTREREPHHSTPSERDHKPQAEPLYRAGTPDLEGGV